LSEEKYLRTSVRVDKDTSRGKGWLPSDSAGTYWNSTSSWFTGTEETELPGTEETELPGTEETDLPETGRELAGTLLAEIDPSGTAFPGIILEIIDANRSPFSLATRRMLSYTSS
jgi:hypothetical protein